MPDERPVYDVLLDYLVFAPIGLAVEVIEELPSLAHKGRQRFERDVSLARVLGRLAVGQAKSKLPDLFGSRSGATSPEPAPAATEEPDSHAEEPGKSTRANESSETGRRTSRPERRAGGGASTTGPARGQGPASGRRSALRPAEAPRPSGGARRRDMPDQRQAPTRPTETIISAVLDAEPAPGDRRGADDSRSEAALGVSRQSEADAPEVSSLAIPGYDTLAASQVVQRLGSLGASELDAIRRYELATRGRRTILHRISQLSAEPGRASA